MKHRILLLVAFFFVSHYAYSQRVANAMPLDIPLNSTKESAVQKLLRYNYNLWDSYEQEGFKVLEYKREYNKKKVRLWLKNNIVSIVSWTLDYDESCVVLAELKDVYDFKPYAQIDEPDTFGDEQSYFYWKGNTIIVGCYELFILSNADAEKRYQKVIQAKQEQKRLEQERKERERQERQEQIRREQERLERERQTEAKRKREADSIARVEAHLNNLKASYSSCRFLFTTDAAFVSCITQESPIAIENEIMSLVDKKMKEISKVIVKGTEFKDQYYARNSMEGICGVPDNMRYVNASIAEYAENKLQDFVSDRKVLSKAYDKAKKKDPNLKCSEFIPSYINDNKKSSNDNRKSSAETTSSKFFAMANLAYSNAPQYSIGLTVGSVKKFGWYVSLNSDISSMANNFKYNNADYECDYLGTINELTAEYSYSGNKRTSRLGATAGMVFKISDPVYAYAGGGYGFRNVFWELENGKWAKCIEDSYKGITLDAGLMMDTRNCAISLGVQTIGVKYIEAKIGVGFTLKGK